MCTWGESCHHCSLYLRCGKTRTQSQHTPCPHHSAYSCWDKGVGIETGNLIEPRPSETFTDLRSLGENIPNNDIIILHHTLWQCTLCCPPSFLLHTHLFTHECTGTHLCAFWYTNTHTHTYRSVLYEQYEDMWVTLWLKAATDWGSSLCQRQHSMVLCHCYPQRGPVHQ